MNSKTKVQSPAYIPVYINTLNANLRNIDRLNNAEVINKLIDDIIVGNYMPNYEGEI